MQRKIILGSVLVLIVLAIGLLESRKTKPSGNSPISQALACPAGQERGVDGVCAPAGTPPPAKQPETVTPAPKKDTTAQSPQESTFLTLKQKSAKYSAGHELSGISGYLNLPASQESITLKSLVGKKVIIVDFWTYSCINCQRTLPYINAWYDKYRNQGLEIIGVETPEFDFEKEKANVQAAIEKFGIKYPVVQDNDYGTWNSYGNRYWPHKYIIDIDGYVAYDHIGEGGYAETEEKIQYLLRERAARLGITADILTDTVNPTAETPSGGTSPETYFGSSRNVYLGNGEKGKTGIQNFNNTSNEAENVAPNTLYLGGAWDVQPEYAKSTGWGNILYNYNAQRVYFVAHAQAPITVEILRDNKSLTKEQAGEDVVIDADGKSRVTISTARLYKLIKEEPTDTQHFLQIVTPDAGLEAFTFTFG